MKIGKKLIALCICALVIGIATAIPLTYFTPPLSSASASSGPFFNPIIDHLLVYFPKPGNMPVGVIETPDGLMVKTVYGALFGATMRYTMPPATTELKDADAKIDLYKFHFYSDQTSLVTTTQAIAVAGKVSNTNAPSGVSFAITDSNAYDNTFTFADGTVYDLSKATGDIEDSIVYWLNLDSTDPYYPQDQRIISGGARILETGGKKATQILSNLENAQTICVDITHVLSVTYKHSDNPSSPSTVTTTSANDKLLYRIELSKTGDREFSYEPFAIKPQDAIVTFSDGTSITVKATVYEDTIVLKKTGDDLEVQIEKAKAGDVIVTLSDGTVFKGTAIPYVGGIVVTDTVKLTDGSI